MKLFKALVLQTLFVPFTYQLQAQTIINPGFGRGESDSTFAVGWYTNQSETRASLELMGGDQNPAAKITPSDNRMKSIRQDININVSEFTKYRLTAKIKTDSISGKRSKVYLLVNLYDDQGFQVNYANNSTQNLKEIPNWTSFSIDFFAPPNAIKLRIGGTMVGKDSGTVWFDDFELDQLPYEPNEIQLSVTAENYIQEVVDIMREKALHKEKLDFESIHQLMQIEANGAKTPEDTYPAISKGLRLLNDGHSFLQTAEQIKKSLGVDTIDVEELQKSPLSHIAPSKADSLKLSINYATGKLLFDNVGYLKIPGFGELYWEAFEFFADSLQHIIEDLDSPQLRGWIVDVRGNWGGVNAAMIAGVGPLLDKDNKYYYINTDQEITATGYYRDGGYGGNTLFEDDSTVILAPSNYQLKNSNLPISVLMNGRTASAAEVVVASFIGQPNVKLFGEPSTGLTTANKAIFLSDGSLLQIATLYLADRNKTVYKKGIYPDVEVHFDGKVGKDLASDPVVLKAVDWMEEYHHP